MFIKIHENELKMLHKMNEQKPNECFQQYLDNWYSIFSCFSTVLLGIHTELNLND
jgi:hypothetical protein